MAGSPIKKARRLAAAPIDPLDEVAPRPTLAAIPWNKAKLTDEQRSLVAQALAERRSRKEVAAALDVSAHTLRRLIKDEPELTQAVEAADETELEEIRSLLLAHGRAGDTVALIFLGKAFHGLRDRDDPKLKVEGSGNGGALLIPMIGTLSDWEDQMAAHQAQYRERREIVPVTGHIRNRTDLGEGMSMERVLPGDLPG